MNEWQILMVFACGIAFDRLMRRLFDTSKQDQP
jgi:hypothetical protein